MQIPPYDTTGTGIAQKIAENVLHRGVVWGERGWYTEHGVSCIVTYVLCEAGVPMS